MLLSKEMLLDYFKQVIELESSIVSQERIISACKTIYEEKKPNLGLLNPPKEPKRIDTRWYDTTGKNILIYVGVGLIVAGFIILCILGSMGSNHPLGETLLALFVPCFLPMIVGISMLIVDMLKVNHDKKLNAELMLQYRKQCDEFEQKNNLVTIEYAKKNREWEHSRQEAYAYMLRPLEETKNALEKIYSSDVIYSKYRNLPALTSIYEYLLTGRCEELSGAHGAYNLYEDEIRKDKVISQLNTVIENLEQIRYNQYMLYEQIKGIQQTTYHIVNEMQQIKGYTMAMSELLALNTYYAGIDAMNSTALAYYRSL